MGYTISVAGLPAPLAASDAAEAARKANYLANSGYGSV
jgi:hypothetical protein